MDMPKPGTQAWENMVDFMRHDMANNMMASRLIYNTRKMFEVQGRDFDAELKAWKEKKDEKGI